MSLLPVGTIVRIIPGFENNEGAELCPGALYMIRATEQDENGCLPYRLGPNDECSWAERYMFEVVDLKPGDLVSVRTIPLEVVMIAKHEESINETLKLVAVKTRFGIAWIEEGEFEVYGLDQQVKVTYPTE